MNYYYNHHYHHHHHYHYHELLLILMWIWKRVEFIKSQWHIISLPPFSHSKYNHCSHVCQAIEYGGSKVVTKFYSVTHMSIYICRLNIIRMWVGKLYMNIWQIPIILDDWHTCQSCPLHMHVAAARGGRKEFKASKSSRSLHGSLNHHRPC